MRKTGERAGLLKAINCAGLPWEDDDDGELFHNATNDAVLTLYLALALGTFTQDQFGLFCERIDLGHLDYRQDDDEDIVLPTHRRDLYGDGAGQAESRDGTDISQSKICQSLRGIESAVDMRDREWAKLVQFH